MVLQVRTRADSADKHTADVNTLVYHKGRLYSGADDGKIIVKRLIVLILKRSSIKLFFAGMGRRFNESCRS